VPSVTAETFGKNVFINCPFDDDYRPLLRPLLFSVVSFGYSPRIASERSDSGESRLSKICQFIEESKYSIHDLSRLRAQEAGALQRMNMPFELGIDYGTRLHGSKRMREKKFLILEKDRYVFQKAISDIAGFDIKDHKNQPARVMRVVREWFGETVALHGLPGPGTMWHRFNDFTADFYRKRLAEGYSDEELNWMPIPEFVAFIKSWVAEKYPIAHSPLNE